MTNQSLSFSSADHQSDAMKEYGFYHGPGFWENGHFWLDIFIVSLISSIALVLALVAVTVQDRRCEGKR
jgi:hypothetical protein